ncbi:MAG TPA: hypothetical protein VEZ24_09205 [Microvirga sp.]|nr:hypothetical protein [Microvirga sp.]
MTRRIVMGKIGTAYDLRISRQGFDAATGDINNNRVISFSALRDANAKAVSVGQITSLFQWVSLGASYTLPPPCIFSLKRNGNMVIDQIERQYFTGDFDFGWWDGTPYALIVSTTAVMVGVPFPKQSPISSGDKFIFMTVRP